MKPANRMGRRIPGVPRLGSDPTVVVVGGLAVTVMLGCLAFAVVSTLRAVGEVSTPGPRPSHRVPQAALAQRSLSDPLAVKIPSIGVNSRLEELRLNPDGTLGVPKDFRRAGWWVEGAHPGGPGPAIVVGHVDSYTGPAVFYRLASLKQGDQVDIELADGTAVRFVVDRVEQVSKDHFPTNAVYSQTTAPTLRLITCGGAFDKRSKSYKDNVVVFASSRA